MPNLNPYTNLSNGTVIFILIAVLVSFILVYVVLRLISSLLEIVKEYVLKQKALNLVYFEIKIPQNNEVEIEAAEQMYSGLLGVGDKLKGFKKYIGARKIVSFEVVAFKESIRFFVACTKSIAGVVDRQINATYPMAEISKVKEYNIFKEDGYVAYASLELSKEIKIPFKTYEELPVDSMSTLTDVLSKLNEGEAACMQMVISPAGSEWRDKIKQVIKKNREVSTEKEEAKKPKVKFEEDTLALMEKKAEKSGFFTDIRIVVLGEDKDSAESHLTNIISVFNQYTKEGGNKLSKKPDNKNKRIASDFIYRIPRESMILNTAELATVFHLPNREVRSPYIKWLLSKKSPAPDFVQSRFEKDSMYLGKNYFRGTSRDIFIKPEDRLRHFYVIGQTGVGKSKLMSGMMIRDMKMGHGCAYIDPHGTDAETILQQVPPERVEDVVIFDPSDLERPLGINMLEFKTQAQRTLATNEMLNIFNSLYNMSIAGGPMFEQYLRYAILLLTEDIESGSTLLEVPKIFADEGYRAYKLSKCQDQEIIDFWKKQAEAAGGEASLKNITPYITSKFTSFLSNAYVRPIIAQQKSTLNFREIMDQQKILIVRLSKGKIGEFNANLLGMILIGKILIAALEREDMSEADRKPFYMYIDEFQNFLTDGIMIILSEARKYRLALTMGHQFIGQLTREGNNTKIRDAIFGNVGNKAIFRIGEEDAPFLKKVVEGANFDESDLQQTENVTSIMKVLVDGKPTPPFTCRSWWGESPYDMISEPSTQMADIARQISRLKYGRDKSLIENEVKMRGLFIKEKEEETKKPNLFSGFAGF